MLLKGKKTSSMYKFTQNKYISWDSFLPESDTTLGWAKEARYNSSHFLPWPEKVTLGDPGATHQQLQPAGPAAASTRSAARRQISPHLGRTCPVNAAAPGQATRTAV